MDFYGNVVRLLCALGLAPGPRILSLVGCTSGSRHPISTMFISPHMRNGWSAYCQVVPKWFVCIQPTAQVVVSTCGKTPGRLAPPAKSNPSNHPVSI